MSQEQRQQLDLIAMQFHLELCHKNPKDCPRCKAALLAKELL